MAKPDKCYPVFQVDICFESYSRDYVLVGAMSKKDLIAHIKDVFPDNQYTLDEYDVSEDGDYPDRKVGDVITQPRFTENQLKEICRRDTRFSRIKQIKHLYTDKPYKELTGFGYYE
jgi:hypothetical protein